MSQLTHTSLKEQARQLVADQQPRLEELNLWLHDNPETAYEEYQSSARLASTLEGYGFEVEYPAYGLDTSFAARSGQEGPEFGDLRRIRCSTRHRTRLRAQHHRLGRGGCRPRPPTPHRRARIPPHRPWAPPPRRSTGGR